MLTIAGEKQTVSEVFHAIEKDPHTRKKPGYVYYLMKIDGSGATTFATMADLIMKLAGYVMGEPEPKKSFSIAVLARRPILHCC